MSEPMVDLDTHMKHVASLTEFVHREIDSYVEQHKLDPVVGVLSPLMAAAVLSITHSMVEPYIHMGEALKRRAEEIRTACPTPQHPAVSLMPRQSGESTAMGRHLNHLIQQHCEHRDQGPNIALAALMTAAAERAGEVGHLATFYIALERMLDGQYRLITAERGNKPTN